MNPRQYAPPRAVARHAIISCCGQAAAIRPESGSRVSCALVREIRTAASPGLNSIVPFTRSSTHSGLQHLHPSLAFAKARRWTASQHTGQGPVAQTHQLPTDSSPTSNKHTTYTILDPASAPDKVTVRIDKSDPSDTKLELFVPVKRDSSQEHASLESSRFQLEAGTYLVHVNPAKQNAGVKYMARWKKTWMQNPSGGLRQKIARASPAIWHEMVARIAKITPDASPADWIEVTFSGPTWTLLDFYHHTNALYSSHIVAAHPSFVSDEWMTMAVKGQKDHMIRLDRDFVKSFKPPEQAKSPGTSSTNDFYYLDLWPQMQRSLDSEYQLPRFLQPPKFWYSKRTLANYVRRITRLKSPMQALHGREDRYLVRDALFFVLFDCRPLEPYISWVALHDALSFLIEYHFIEEARDFLLKMDGIGIAPTTDFYNILLTDCARIKDHVEFRKILGIMDRRGLRPNSSTWSALLLAAPNRQSRQELVCLMKVKGVLGLTPLDPTQVTQVIQYSCFEFLESGGSATAYLWFLEAFFGPTWVNKASVKMLLQLLPQAVPMLEVLDIAMDLIQRNPSAQDAMSKLVANCSGQNNADLAVWLAIYTAQTLNRKANSPDLLHHLFKVGRSSRMYNVCRVVWIYAMARGAARRMMRAPVLQSLRARGATGMLNTVQGRWYASFGAVICRLPVVEDDPLEANEIVEAERVYFLTHKPTEPFVDMLAEALVRDRVWANTGLKNSTSVKWKIENAIHVPVAKAENLQQAVFEATGRIFQVDEDDAGTLRVRYV